MYASGGIKLAPAPAHRDPFITWVSSRLTAGQSFIKGYGRYAYPAGTSFCLCKRKQNTLGASPKTPKRTGTPARNGYAVPKRGLNGAYKVSQTHLPPSPPSPVSGEGVPVLLPAYLAFYAWQVLTAVSIPRQIQLPHPLTATVYKFES